MTQNIPKKGKSLFEGVKADFCWNIGPDYMISENEENYRKHLKNIYKYNPVLHGFDIEAYSIFDK